MVLVVLKFSLFKIFIENINLNQFYLNNLSNITI